MPEGHLIHRYAAEQHALLAGRTVNVSSPQGRFAAEASMLDGARLLQFDAVGKHLFADFESARTVHVHLGMRGLYLVHPAPPVPPPKRGVRLRLVAADAGGVDLIAPSRCELIDRDGRARVTAALGPDPLRADADAGEAARRLSSAGTTLGAALLDQAVWSGLGNAFRAELPYLARLHPATASGHADAVALWRLTVEQMRVAQEIGTIATVDGRTDAKWVYKQEHCRGCGARVATAPLAGRTAYWCPVEQPAP